MNVLVMAIAFISGNFIYQYGLDSPNYHIAFDRAYWQAVAMAFIVFYPKLIKSWG